MASVLPTQISFESARLCSAVRPAQSRQRVVVILSRGRVELRGFGAFSTRARDARLGRNPRTGTSVDVDAKRVPFFKTGKELHNRLNANPGSKRRK